VFTTARKEW